MRRALAGISSGIGAGVGFGVFQTATSIIRGTASSLFEATLTADSLQGGMEALTGSVEAANARLDELRTLAKDPGLGFEQVTRGDIALQSVGLSAELSTRAMKEFGNALAVVGKGKADLDGVLLAITQIVSKGKVSAEEINQIAERVPQIRKVMQEAFGTADTEAIQKMGIPVERFIDLVVSAFERTVPRALVRMQGKIDNFTDALTSRMADVGAGIATGLLGPLDESTATLEKAAEEAKAFGATLGAIFGGGFEFIKTAKSGLDLLGEALSKVTIDTLDLVPALHQQRLAVMAANAAEEAIAATTKKVEKNTSELKAKLDQAEQSAREYEDAWKDIAASQDEAAEKMKKTSEEMGRLKVQLDAANDAKLEMQLDNDLERLGIAEAKLKAINNQINATNGQKGGEEITARLDIERVKAETDILRIKQAINQEQDRATNADTKALDTAAKKVADQEQALRLFELELAIAEAASRGQDRKVEKLERERAIIEETARLMNELGIGYDEAAKKAEQLVNAEARANGETGGRSTIRGYSQDQGGVEEARGRATANTQQARADYDEAIRRNFGTFSEVDASQQNKFGNLFGPAPAEQAAPKGGGNGDLLSSINEMKEALLGTTEKLDAALT